MSKRNRQWAMGVLISILVIAVWWVYFHEPAMENMTSALEQYQLLQDRHDRLSRKLADLEGDGSEKKDSNDDAAILETLVIKGENLEEVNAEVQGEVQKFLQENDIQLQKYQVLKSGKWMDYELGRLEFSIQANHLELSNLLRFLSQMKHLVRLERFNINYSRSKTYTLRVNFRLETLFVDKLKDRLRFL